MHNDDIADIISCGLIFVGGLMLGALLIAMIALIRSFVLIRLWAWFIVPVFNFPVLNYPYAIGFSLVVGLFAMGIKTEDSKNKIWLNIISPLIALFMGWIVKMFI